MRLVWIFGALLLAFGGAACSTADTSEIEQRLDALETRIAAPTPLPTPTVALPDRVVGVSWACKTWTTLSTRASDASGSTCRAPFHPQYCGRVTDSNAPLVDNCLYVQSVSAVVTVRSASGATYQITVQDPAADIELGSFWPP